MPRLVDKTVLIDDSDIDLCSSSEDFWKFMISRTSYCCINQLMKH